MLLKFNIHNLIAAGIYEECSRQASSFKVVFSGDLMSIAKRKGLSKHIIKGRESGSILTDAVTFAPQHGASAIPAGYHHKC